MKITVVNWAQYQPRKDVTRSSWFRMEHALALSTKYLSLTQRDIMALVYIFSLCSEENRDSVEIQPIHAQIFARMTIDELRAAALNLQRNEIVLVEDTQPIRENHGAVTLRTDEQDGRTVHTDAREPLTLTPPDPKPKPEKKQELPELARLWNERATPELPRVTRCSDKRRKRILKAWKAEPERSFWEGVIDKVNASDFLTGKKPSKEHPDWKADFEFLLDDDKLTKILEGFYDNRGQVVSAPRKSAYAQQMEAQHGHDPK